MLRVTASTVVMVAVMLGGCGSSHRAATEWLTLTLHVSNTSPQVGESVTLRLTVANTTNAPQSVIFATGQRYDFKVRDADGEIVWRWSHGIGFVQAMSRETLKPGESWEFTATWDLRDNEGTAVAPGNYTAQGDLVCTTPAGTEALTVTIGPAG